MILYTSDLAVVPGYYRESEIYNYLLGIQKKNQLTLLQFRRRLAESSVLQNKLSIAKRSRPS